MIEIQWECVHVCVWWWGVSPWEPKPGCASFPRGQIHTLSDVHNQNILRWIFISALLYIIRWTTHVKHDIHNFFWSKLQRLHLTIQCNFETVLRIVLGGLSWNCTDIHSWFPNDVSWWLWWSPDFSCSTSRRLTSVDEGEITRNCRTDCHKIWYRHSPPTRDEF